MRDDRTVNKNWPLPYRGNSLADDVERIRGTFAAIDTAIASLESSIEDINTKLETLGIKASKSEIFDKLGFFIDDEGYLCQANVNQDDNDDNPETPLVLIDGEPAVLTTKNDIKELLAELNFGQ